MALRRLPALALLLGLGGRSAAALPEFRQGMRVSGTGQPGLDGSYRPVAANSTKGFRCYQKDQGARSRADVSLCQAPDGHWLLQPARYIGKGVGFVLSALKDVPAPQSAGPWLIFKDKQWVPAPDITVTPESRGMAATITIMTFGCLAVVALMTAWALSRAAEVRELTYKIVSITLAIFISYASMLRFYQFGVGIFCHGKGSMVIGIALFTLAYFSLLPVLWKAQYSDRWCIAAGSLLSGAAALLALPVFSLALVKTAEAFPAQLAGAGIKRVNAERIGAFVALLLTWCLIRVYRFAAAGLRQEWFAQEPTSPWVPKPVFVLPAPSRACGGCLPAPPAAKPEEKMKLGASWQEKADYYHFLVEMIVQSYLFSQMVFFLFATRFPDLIDREVRSDRSELTALAVTFLISLVVGLRLHRTGSGSSTEWALSCSTAWALYRLVHELAFRWLPDCAPLANVFAAFALTLVCMLLARLLLRIRLSSDEKVEAKYVAALCFGMIIGVSWSGVIEESIDTLVPHGLSHGGSLAFGLVVSLLMAAITGYTWWAAIVPRQAASQGAFAAVIVEEGKLLAAASE